MRNNRFFGSPTKPFEYMPSVTAVIASNVGQITKSIRPGGNGILVETGILEALTTAINQ
jgi:glycosyltransferase involved in cell wall biosynthesis